MNKNNNEHIFSNMNLFKKTIIALVGAFLIILPISLLVGTYFFGFAGLFTILEVPFVSFYALLIFVIAYFLLALVTDVFSVILFQFTSAYVSGGHKLFLTRMIIDCAFSWFALHTVDEFMNTITIPLIIEIVAVLLVFFIEEALSSKKSTLFAGCDC